ncbi:hypothetical protein [Sphingobacterium bovistauri]|uniref:Uncharacterized protein n=1 Tax=Sphingobacterium bovistauri TaxID=2781959 RepID=A0ABS7Z6I8_9SPHI|nr:hypothetical protein [Sphingobacterium bovistauri]MCA5005628.1 hypothetical protein [Sphingobacterium bovistauri]
MSKFSSNINYLRQYVNGELSPTEMYEIERAMHNDEMLMDIIEGLQTEKELKSEIPRIDLIAKIKSRTSTESPTKVFNIKKMYAAASIIVVFTLGALYFQYDNQQKEIVANDPIATSSPSHEPNTANALSPDSTLSDTTKEEIINKEKLIAQNNISTAKTTSAEPKIQKKIIAYEAKPKMQVVIEGPKYLNRDKVEVIEIAARGTIKPTQTELLSGRIGTTAQPHVNSNPSIAKTQADLQRLDLDPQTKANLTAVLSRQTQENKTELKEKHAETSSIGDVLISGNALATKSNSDSKIILSNESLGVIGTKTIQNGNPTTGWTKFNLYIKEQLGKKGLTTYFATISFDLDASMKPTHIEIKSSSDKKIFKYISEILKNGPTWENKDPNHPIFIRINSEEEMK